MLENFVFLPFLLDFFIYYLRSLPLAVFIYSFGARSNIFAQNLLDEGFSPQPLPKHRIPKGRQKPSSGRKVAREARRMESALLCFNNETHTNFEF
jgi:hypothetical protein